ncbi:MAG: hypothetical protein ACRCX2_28605 [Paraclostridium sp.]
MSTRCVIGIERDNDMVEYVYCHWDGYINGGAGDTLKKHYDRGDMETLIANGDMSSLDENPYKCKYYKDDNPEGNNGSSKTSTSLYFSEMDIRWSDYRYLLDKHNRLLCYDCNDTIKILKRGVE